MNPQRALSFMMMLVTVFGVGCQNIIPTNGSKASVAESESAQTTPIPHQHHQIFPRQQLHHLNQGLPPPEILNLGIRQRTPSPPNFIERMGPFRSILSSLAACKTRLGLPIASYFFLPGSAMDIIWNLPTSSLLTLVRT